MINKYVYNDYFVGQTFPEQIGKHDSNIFDLTDTGSILFITLNKPTTHEMNQFKSKEKRMRMSFLQDALWMTFKFGDLDWCEAPFSPHLSKQAHLPQTLNVACNDIAIVVVDSADGKVKHCERLPYSEAFSAAMKTAVMILLQLEFNRDEYDLRLGDVQAQLSTNQIAELAVVECVF